MDEKIAAIDLDLAGWTLLIADMGQKSFRAAQIFAWIWKRGVHDVNEMTDLSKPLREELADRLDWSFPTIEKEERSKDGSRKFLFSMRSGTTVECAVLKQNDRMTACVSSQAGCPIGCPFCRTGQSGFERDLSAGEIASQFVVMERVLGRPINSMVMMGMGEPLLNEKNVFGAIALLNDAKGRALGIRHITVSTAGIVPAIVRMADRDLVPRLAISLHAPYDDLRDEMVPCNSAHPIAELIGAIRSFQEKTGDRVTIEYSLFDGLNDGVEHARKLVGILKGLKVFVNLIPGNAVPGYQTSKPQSVLRFQSVLKSAGIESELRTPKGADINAACGQLKLASKR